LKQFSSFLRKYIQLDHAALLFFSAATHKNKPDVQG
jgi:hypothetical protein